MIMRMGKEMMFVAPVGLMLLATSVLADWQPGDPHKMHYPQLPDLVNGMDVLATEPKILADDWRCSGSGPVTDIHFWGSWLNDDIGDLHTDVYIFADIPANQSPTGYSMPGELLWSRHFHPTDIAIGEVVTASEPFFDPNVNEIIGSDTQVIQYNFFIPETEAFVQEEGQIYWLGVQKRNLADPFLFGWKSSADHFNDDAVYGDFQSSTIPGMQPPGSPIGWNELIDPRSGESMDLAFVITPEPGSISLLVLGGLALLRRRR
jgi:hypothetical protein